MAPGISTQIENRRKNEECILTQRIGQIPMILGIGTANPDHVVSQHEYSEKYVPFLFKSEKLQKMAESSALCSGVEQRHIAVTHEMYEKIPSLVEFGSPSMDERLSLFREIATDLATSAAERAIQDWGGNKNDITHIVTFSNTGQTSPGLDLSVINSIGLRGGIKHFYVSFNGCQSCLIGLRMAADISRADPRNRVLIVSAEVNSANVQSEDPSNPMKGLVAGSLFGDGAAVVIVGCAPTQQESPIYEIHGCHSRVLPDTEDAIRSYATTQGVNVEFSNSTPSLLGKSIGPFVHELVGTEVDFEDLLWAVHPGGKPALDAIQDGCHLSDKKLDFSRSILRDFGNMASATTLFILDKIRRDSEFRGEAWTVAVAFGPGVSLEGTLLKLV